MLVTRSIVQPLNHGKGLLSMTDHTFGVRTTWCHEILQPVLLIVHRSAFKPRQGASFHDRPHLWGPHKEGIATRVK